MVEDGECLGSSNYKRELSTLIYVHDVLVKRVFEYQISHNTHPALPPSTFQQHQPSPSVSRISRERRVIQFSLIFCPSSPIKA